MAKAKAQIVRGLRALVDPADYDEKLEAGELDAGQVYALLTDDVMTEVNGHLRELYVAGGDVLKHTVVVIGENPAHPGKIMIQTQTDAQRPGFELNDELTE